MNTPTKGEGQIEIPDAAFKNALTSAATDYKEKSKVDRDSGFLADFDFARGAEWAEQYFRSLSPSIDRYPRWIDAFKELPGEDWEGHIKYADCGAEAGKFGNLDDIKALIEYEKDHPVMWLYEPSESPAIQQINKSRNRLNGSSII
jgi:hypothetical protein